MPEKTQKKEGKKMDEFLFLKCLEITFCLLVIFYIVRSLKQ